MVLQARTALGLLLTAQKTWAALLEPQVGLVLEPMWVA
jgi:hypothetical protein